MMADAELMALATRVGAQLKRSGALLVAAESCTGGWIGQAVTAVAGSSDWFERGFVTYSNAAKQEMLGVRAETIARHGAVSEQTAHEMAAGALAHSHGTIAVAVTGVAGPGGGSDAKPVGMVCFAWARGAEVRAETRRFDGDRDSVRRQSVIRALEGVVQWLDEPAARA
ncbi:MAG: CinA family protein [Burkholderiales bacterium]